MRVKYKSETSDNYGNQMLQNHWIRLLLTWRPVLMQCFAALDLYTDAALDLDPLDET